MQVFFAEKRRLTFCKNWDFGINFFGGLPNAQKHNEDAFYDEIIFCVTQCVFNQLGFKNAHSLINRKIFPISSIFLISIFYALVSSANNSAWKSKNFKRKNSLLTNEQKMLQKLTSKWFERFFLKIFVKKLSFSS